MKDPIMYLTPEESEELQHERRRATHDLRTLGLSDGRLDELEAKHLGGHIYLAGRDRDGSLMASVRFPRAPGDLARYVRRLRIVRGGAYKDRTVPYRQRT